MIGMKIVSACLIGINCTYKGGNKLDKRLYEAFKKGELFPVCPEVLAGMTTPRANAEIVGGTGSDVLDGKARVIEPNGKDATDYFVEGAKETLRAAKAIGAKEAVLKARSPSCGCGKTYDGTFTNTLIDGDGVTSALLKRNGITVKTEEDL
jgi:uncharacterized protein YbbK (DUF523 family)